ncbi:MAG: YraN family protein [Alphaproteobacteria bacterium]|nr:YraN family protein [Alphaproteobacteria bacterium]
MNGRGRPTHDRRAAYGRGLRAETFAVLLLRLKGYRILARRYLGGGGEADIIARRGGVIAFVEVKARATLEQGLLLLDHDKRRRMSRAARHWLARYPGAEHMVWRGDAIILLPWRWPRHLPGVIELLME